MRHAKRLKKYATSRKVRAELGLRPPIKDASELHTWKGWTKPKGGTTWWRRFVQKRPPSSKKIIKDLADKHDIGRRQASEKSKAGGFLSKLVGAGRKLFNRKAS